MSFKGRNAKKRDSLIFTLDESRFRNHNTPQKKGTDLFDLTYNPQEKLESIHIQVEYDDNTTSEFTINLTPKEFIAF